MNAYKMSIKNYQYHVQLNKETIPDESWNQARAMNRLWNKFVEMRVEFLAAVAELYQDKAKHRAEINARWKEFDNSLVETTRLAESKAELGWEAREGVLERFRTASARALKTGAELRFKSQRLTQISIYHRFSSGGLDTKQIFAGKSKKLKLTGLPAEVYLSESHQNRRHNRFSRGVFGTDLADTPLPVSIYLHREIPTGKLKIAQLVGKLDELTRDWNWTLVLAIDTAEIEFLSEIKPVAALDLNWRRRGDYLRIGYLKDTAGNRLEIRLPFVEEISRAPKTRCAESTTRGNTTISRQSSSRICFRAISSRFKTGSSATTSAKTASKKKSKRFTKRSKKIACPNTPTPFCNTLPRSAGAVCSSCAGKSLKRQKGTRIQARLRKSCR